MLSQAFSQILPILMQLVVLLVATAALAAVPKIRARIKNQLAADALSLLTTTVAALVASSADEVRAAKTAGRTDLLPAIRDRVLREAKTLGADSFRQLQTVGGLTPDQADKLLVDLLEQQVEALRARAAGAVVVQNVTTAAALNTAVVPRTLAPGETLTDASPEAEAASGGRLTSERIGAPSGQSGAAQFSAMAWALLVAGAIGVVLYAVVGITGCTPAREAVMRATSGVPAASHCEPATWRCNGTMPEHCSASGRWWPSLSRRADGSQRQCARGCSMDASGVASCIGPIEAEAGL